MNEITLLNSLFDDLLCGTPAHQVCSVWNSGAAPKVDVMEQKDKYILNMELPGLTENDVNIEIDHDNLAISSLKKAEDKDAPKEKYLIRERNHGEFSRKFVLPENTDYDGITASFKNGLLTITIMKKEKAEPKKIQVTAA